MFRKVSSPGSGRDLLTVGGLLLLAVVTPTVCFLWFMLQAVENERLAVRQRLTETYHQRLTDVAKQVETMWRKVMRLSSTDPSDSPSWVFAQNVGPVFCDGAVVLDASGLILYPSIPLEQVVDPGTNVPEWERAVYMEKVLGDWIAAASAYSNIESVTSDPTLTALAARNRARCLAQSGQKGRAVELLFGEFFDERHKGTKDGMGRSIRADALLYALRVSGDPAGFHYRQILSRIVDLLNNYRDSILPGSQRLFLMRAVLSIAPDTVFPCLQAEDLSARFLNTQRLVETHLPLSDGMMQSINRSPELATTRLEGIWSSYAAEKQVVALHREENILKKFEDVFEATAVAPETRIQLTHPFAANWRPDPFLEAPIGPDMPKWRITLHLEGLDPFAAATDSRIASYLWGGVCVLAITLFLFFLIARTLNRQMKLTRLKNDLIANVSHELKTPVSSIRLLTDTLLEGKIPEGRESRDYLETISRENRRLSGLIDNFLTFSRMERNKHAFNFEAVDPKEVVETSAISFEDRSKGPNCNFEFSCEGDLPRLQGDRDSLVTVLLNLLDNAYKYSGEKKNIALKCYRASDNVCFEVSDNGVGIPKRARKKIFDRFYQVDQSLSRSTGGTGLGLSIVKFIVEAHRGEVTVSENPEGGSVFTVKIPALCGVETPR